MTALDDSDPAFHQQKQALDALRKMPESSDSECVILVHPRVTPLFDLCVLCLRHDWPLPSKATISFVENCKKRLQGRLERTIQSQVANGFCSREQHEALLDAYLQTPAPDPLPKRVRPHLETHASIRGRSNGPGKTPSCEQPLPNYSLLP